MKHRILNNLYNKKSFWNTRGFFKRQVSFRAYSKSYQARQKYRENKISFKVLQYSLLDIIKMATIAVIFVAVVEYFSFLSKDRVDYELSSDELGLLLSTLVTVTGVFLGLYFTALSAVAGNLFLRAPAELQNLFLRDRKGQQYIRTLVLTTIIGIYYLLLRSYGFEVGFAGPTLITVLAVYTVVRFMALGAQTFYFIHPTEASSTLTGDAADAINDASFKGFAPTKPFLQNHYRKQAQIALTTLSSLVDFGIKPVKLSSQQMLTIARYAGSITEYYIERKKHIPTESLWYARKHEHQKWLIADESSVTMSINTRTSLQPKEVINALWFEERSMAIILKIFENLAGQKEWSHAQAVLEVVVAIVEKCGAEFYDDSVALAISMTEKSIDKVLSGMSGSLNDEDKRGRLALIDSLGRLPVGALVSLSRYMQFMSKEKLVEEIDQIKWSKAKSVYYSKLPGKTLAENERNQRQYANEIIIEGHAISPQWYLQNLATQQYLAQLKKYYDLVKSYNESIFEKRIDELITRQEPLQAAHLNDRWMEFTNKLLSLGQKVQSFIESCSDLNKVEDLPWTSMDSDQERETVQSYNRQATDKIAQLVVPLSLLPENELKDLPDYFGQAFIFGLQAAYDAAKSNDPERLRAIFNGVFAASLKATDKVREDVKGWLEQSQILLVTECTEDILVLSGFIKIYAELYENTELWEICQETWDRYLTISEDPKSTIERIVTACIYRDSRLGVIMHRATVRFNWDRMLTQVFEEKGFDVGLFSRNTNPFDQDAGPDHPSPLIRTMVKHSLIDYEARAIFFVTYLSKHPAAADITLELPDQRHLERQLEREEQQSEIAGNQDPDISVEESDNE